MNDETEEVKKLKCSCPVHKGENPLSVDNFYSRPNRQRGYSEYCKECAVKNSQKNRAKKWNPFDYI